MHKDQTDPAVAPRAKHIDRFAARRQPNRHKQTLWSAMLVLASSFTAVTHADPSHPEDTSNNTEANHAASQKLQAQFDQLIAEIQATGEPILAEDIQPLNIPDHDNKAVYIQQAFAEHWPTVPGQDTTILETDWYGNGGIDPETNQPIPDPITDNTAYLAQCQPLIDQVLKASQANQSDWQREYIPCAVIDTRMPELSECRVLASLLADASERHLAQNNPDQAMRCIQAIFQVEASLALETHNLLIDHLVAISTQTVGINALEDALPHLGKQQAPCIRQCIQALNDESLLHASAHRGLGMERLGFVDAYRALMNGLADPKHPNAKSPMAQQFTRNLWTSDAIWYLQNMSQWRDLFHQTNSLAAFEQAKQLSPNFSNETFNKAINNRFMHPLSGLLTPALGAFANAHYKALTSRRLAATGLALKLYQLDHGQYPATLDALVPAYLPAIPIDPMDPQGRPLGYLPNGCKLYRSDAYDTGDFFQDEPWTTSPDPAQALPIQGPPVVHNIGPSGVARGCPIEVWDSGEVRSDHKMSNDYALNWFALAPWPSVEPTQAYLERGPEKPFMVPSPDFELRDSNDAND